MNSFSLQEQNGVTYLTSALLSHAAGISHGFSTRKGGVSKAPWDSLNLGVSRGDELEDVRENYRRFCAVIGTDEKRVVLSQQEHLDNIRLVTEEDVGKGLWRKRDYTHIDALLCNTPNIPLVIFSADCGIILLHDPVTRSIGAVHAGWRGVAQGIVHKAVLAMQETFGTDPANILAAIGPAIGQCCFETDEDVPTAMRKALGDVVEPFIVKKGAKWHLDLKSINAHWLTSAGVDPQHIDICDYCTACNPELFWSHRKMGNIRGAQIAMIALK